MNEEELQKINNEIKDYPVEIVISLWDISLQEIKRRMEKEK